MNGKKIGMGLGIALVLIALGCIGADYYGKSLRIGTLTGQLDSLDRAYGERERELEGNLNALGSLSEDALAAVEGARRIAERAGGELRTAAGDLREAKRVLKNLAGQIEDLQGELDDCRAGLYRIRDLAGVEAGG
jgi:chromosome segregation ATPase